MMVYDWVAKKVDHSEPNSVVASVVLRVVQMVVWMALCLDYMWAV